MGEVLLLVSHLPYSGRGGAELRDAHAYTYSSGFTICAKVDENIGSEERALVVDTDDRYHDGDRPHVDAVVVIEDNCQDHFLCFIATCPFVNLILLPAKGGWCTLEQWHAFSILIKAQNVV